MIVFRKLYEKIERKNLRWINVSKQLKFTDFFLGIFLKNRIFLEYYSAKELYERMGQLCNVNKKYKTCKKCISVYVIIKMNGKHFLPSSIKQVILQQKMKNHFPEIFLFHDSIHFHVESLLYFQKKSIIIWNLLFFKRNPALENSLLLTQCMHLHFTEFLLIFSLYPAMVRNMNKFKLRKKTCQREKLLELL